MAEVPPASRYTGKGKQESLSTEESLRRVLDMETQLGELPATVRNNPFLSDSEKQSILRAAAKVANIVSLSAVPSANTFGHGWARTLSELEEADKESGGLLKRFVSWEAGDTSSPESKATETDEILRREQGTPSEGEGSPRKSSASKLPKSSKVRTARPGQKGARTDAGTSPLKSLADLGPALSAAQKSPVPESEPEPVEESKTIEPAVEVNAPESNPQPEPKAPEVAESLPPDATKAETKEHLKTSVSKLQDFAEKAGFGAERTAMFEAEKAYLTKHREFFAKNNVLSRLYKRNIGTRVGSSDMAELKALKQKYDDARIAYDGAVRGRTFDEHLPGKEKMDARLEEKYARLKEKGELPKNLFGKSPDFEQFKRQALEKRAERSQYHIRAREILNRAGKQVDARAEGLNEKGLELWDRVPNMLAKANAGLEKKFGKNGARAVKALAVTSFVVGGMAVGALGGAAVLSAGALAGVGGATFGRKLLASTIIGPAARAAARVVYDRTRGKRLERGARGELESMDKDKGQLTAKRIAAYDSKRIKLSERASGEYQKRERGLFEFAVTFAVGGGAAATLFNEEVVERTVDSLPPEVRHEVEAEARQIGEAIERAAEEVEQEAAGAPEQVVGTADTVSEAAQLTERAWHAEPLTVVLERLEGADHLFTEMRTELLEQYPDEATRPPAVEHLLEAGHPNALSREFGFAAGENSLVMYEGDSFSINEQGQLVFVRDGVEPVTLLEANGERPEGFEPLNEREEFKVMPSVQVSEATDTSPNTASAVSEPAPVEPPASVAVESSSEPEPSQSKTDEPASQPPPGQPLESFVASPASEAEASAPVTEASTPQSALPTESVPGQSLENFVAQPETGLPETQTIHESIRNLEGGPASIPATPAVFDGFPHESFTNNYGQTIDPSRAGVYENADGSAFVFGGDYAQMRQAAEAFAREHPGTLVTFEDRPHLTEGGEVERSAARLLSDERGRIVVATHEENRALIEQVPNPYTFVSRIK